MVAAYAIGRERGRDEARTTRTATTTPTAPTPTTTGPTSTTPGGPATTGPAQIAAGRGLFTSSGCSGCHSLDGSRGVGPTLKGLAGSQVTLIGGQTVTADDAYLTQSIRSPDAQVVEGYSAGAMPDLGLGDGDITALVAFLRSQK
jgi:cytochrome c oxidase subunit 2